MSFVRVKMANLLLCLLDTSKAKYITKEKDQLISLKETEREIKQNCKKKSTKLKKNIKRKKRKKKVKNNKKNRNKKLMKHNKGLRKN